MFKTKAKLVFLPLISKILFLIILFSIISFILLILFSNVAYAWTLIDNTDDSACGTWYSTTNGMTFTTYADTSTVNFINITLLKGGDSKTVSGNIFIYATNESGMMADEPLANGTFTNWAQNTNVTITVNLSANPLNNNTKYGYALYKSQTATKQCLMGGATNLYTGGGLEGNEPHDNDITYFTPLSKMDSASYTDNYDMQFDMILYYVESGCTEEYLNTTPTDWLNMTDCLSTNLYQTNRSYVTYNNGTCAFENVTYWEYLNNTCQYVVGICNMPNSQFTYITKIWGYLEMIPAFLLFLGMWGLGYWFCRTGNFGLGISFILITGLIDFWIGVNLTESNYLGSELLGIGFFCLMCFTPAIIIMMRRPKYAM